MKKEIKWSEQQERIFHWFMEGEGNLLVRARAGTGKTSTIEKALSFAPESKILYAVFNKRNQKEADAKITDNRVEVKTLHSLGFAFIKKLWSNAKPDDSVEFDRAERLFPRATKADIVSIVKLVGFVKNMCINPTHADFVNIAEQQDIQFEDSGIISFSMALIEESKKKDAQGRISFNDMVWLPVALNLVKPTYSLVVIDEAQDMNLPQLTMARGASKGRVVVVGDDRQAIYGFRGAAKGGMEMMKATLRAAEMSLTATFRCPKSVVRHAQKIVPDYCATDDAPEGEVKRVANTDSAQVGDAILSRLNAPLMPAALSLLRKNIPARIEGRDIGKQLITMARTMKARDVKHFIERVNEWERKQIERLENVKNADKKIEGVSDIAATLICLAQDSDSVVKIEMKITNLFQDTDENSRPAVVLSTVHKAKGLEWPRVFILEDTFKMKNGSGNEEENIRYVAMTRSQKNLYFVGGEVSSLNDESSRAIPRQADSGKETVAAIVPPVIISKPPSRDSLKSNLQVTKPESELIEIKVGMICEICDVEHVCTVEAESNSLGAIMRKDRKSDPVKLLGGKTHPAKIIRTIAVNEIENFLSRKPARDTESSEAGNTTTGKNMSKKIKTKAVKVKSSGGKSDGKISGAAQFVREQYAAGKSKTATFAAVLEKWPKFQHDQAGLESRWNTAERIAKAAKADKKAPAAKKTAPAKKNAVVAKLAGKKAAPAKPAKAKKAEKSSAPPARSEVAADLPPPREEVVVGDLNEE